MKKRFNLQLFDDGGQSGAGGSQGGAAGTGDGGQAANAGNNGRGGSYSFQQAEEIANARAQRAEKAALASYFKQQGMSEEEVSKAIATYKAQQAASRPNVDSITKERDDALAELAPRASVRRILTMSCSRSAPSCRRMTNWTSRRRSPST